MLLSGDLGDMNVAEMLARDKHSSLLHFAAHLRNYMCVCVCCVSMYVCMCVCIYACMYVCMYVCMYACMHVRMYVCMYVCKDGWMDNRHLLVLVSFVMYDRR